MNQKPISAWMNKIPMKKSGSLIVSLSIIIWCFPIYANETVVIVGKFSEGDISGWEEKIFNGRTSYDLISLKDKSVIKAVSSQAASGFYKQIRVDLNKTPFLNWNWKIENTLDVKDEKLKSGDDYPARIYLIFKTSKWTWNINALNYVWSSVNPAGSNWSNAFIDKVWMIAVTSGEEKVGQWISEKRNVQQDYFRFFNSNIQFVEAVAIMTDTDNSKSTAVAYYGDIYFSAH